jgi:hypothetical protein
MKNEYYVAIDSNGEPYIAHALFGRNSGGSNSRGSHQNVKYLEKIKDGARTRYFYTQDELRAFYNKGTKAAKKAVTNVKQTARDKIGITAKENRDKTQRALTDARARDMAADKIFKVNYQKEQNAKQNLEEAKNKTKAAQANLDRLTKQHDLHANIASGHKKSFDDLQKLGAEKSDTAKQAYQLFVNNNVTAADLKVKMNQAERDLKSAQRKEAEAEKAYNDAYEKTTKDLDKYTHESGYGMKDSYMSDTMWNAHRAEKEYAKTPLAKIENVKEKVEQTTDNLAANVSKAKTDAETFGKEVAKGIKNMASDMSGAGTKESLNKVKVEREEAIKKAEKAEQKAEKLMSRADRDGWYNTLNEAVKASDAELEAVRALNDAKTADERVKFWTKIYGDTPLGKIENAKEKVESTAKSLKEQVKSLIPGAKVSGNKLVMPSGNEVIIPEKYIKEQIIPESFILEQTIREQKHKK